MYITYSKCRKFPDEKMYEMSDGCPRVQRILNEVYSFVMGEVPRVMVEMLITRISHQAMLMSLLIVGVGFHSGRSTFT